MQATRNIPEFQDILEQLKKLSSGRTLHATPEAQPKHPKEAKTTHEFISNAVNFAKSVKQQENNAGLNLNDWNALPKQITENREFITSVLTNKDIILNKALQKQLLQLYWKDQAKLLQDNPKFIEALFTSVLNKTPPSSADQNQQLLQTDPVLMHSLTTVANYLTSAKLKTQDPKQLAENLQGMKQALGTLHEIGGMARSESLQKTASLLNHSLDLSVGLSQLTGKALPEGLVAMGATLGQIGMVVSAVIGIYNVFKKRKKDDNAFAQAILSYLQTISHQIYHMHADMLRGFEMVTDNQKKMLNVMIKSVEHLDLLIRAEAQNIHNQLNDVEQHLDTRIDNMMRLTVASGQEIHLQPFHRLMNKIDFYIKNKASITPEKIKKLNYELSNWIQKDSHFSANPLHTGTIQLAAQRDDLLRYINTEFKDVEQHPEKAIQNMAFLAQILEKSFNIPMVKGEEKIDTAAIPNPMIWLYGVNKYLDFRKEFNDVLENDKETIVSSMEVAENLSHFIKSLQTNPAIYTKLFDAYEAELKNIQSIYKMATNEVNKEINTKLLKLEDQKALTDEKMVFDISKDLQISLSNLDMLYNETATGGNLDIGFNFHCPRNGSWYSTYFKSGISEKCISFNEFKNTLSDEQKMIIKNISFLQRLNILSNKSSFNITIKNRSGEKMGILTSDISFSKKIKNEENKDETINLYKIRYDINGNASSSMTVKVDRNRLGLGMGIIAYSSDGFDGDLTSNNYILQTVPISNSPSVFVVQNVSDLSQRFVNKRQFDAVELASEYKTHKDYLQKTRDDYILTQRKNIIKTIHDAGIGHGKEPYQSALKSTYERLDGYKTLLKFCPSIAGMSQNDGTKFPEVLTNLPDSKSIHERSTTYLDTATIDTPWPVDSLLASLPAAKQAVMDAIHQEAAQTSPDEDKHAPTPSLLQFVSPLQVEITMHYYQLLALMLSTNDQPVKKVLSEEDERFIKQKYEECLGHFTLQEEWINDVDTSWRCYKSLKENLNAIQLVLREDCSDINEMAQHLPEITSRLLGIHNLLATYYRKQGYNLDISIIKDGSDQLTEIKNKLKPALDAKEAPDETLATEQEAKAPDSPRLTAIPDSPRFFNNPALPNAPDPAVVVRINAQPNT